MFKYSLYGQLLYLSKSTPSVTKVHLFVILIFRYIYWYITDVIFSIFTFSLQIYCKFILAYFTIVMQLLSVFYRYIQSAGVKQWSTLDNINREPDWNDTMINIQSWGWRYECFLEPQLDPHAGVGAHKGWYYAMSLHNLGHLYIFWPYTEDVCNGPSITRPPTNLVVPITGALTAYKGIEGRACTIRRSGWKDLSMYSVV